MLMVFKMVSPNVRVINVGRGGHGLAETPLSRRSVRRHRKHGNARGAGSMGGGRAGVRQVSRACPGHVGPNLIYITLYGKRWQDLGGDLYFGDFQKSNRSDTLVKFEAAPHSPTP